MTADRIKEIQETTAFPNSVSVCQALIKVWNECEHEQNSRMYSEEDVQEYAEFCIRCDREGLPCIVVKDWFEQFKKTT